MLKILLIFSSLTFIVIFAIPLERKSTIEWEPCAYKACQKLDANKINVHLIPHSHNDVGWLKTLEDYYYGFHDEIQNVGVEYILSSVLQALKQNPSRRYIQVETAFFWKWWTHQSDDNRKLFKSFVENGQIEMVGGGWSMNDEACTNYQSTINQFTLGLRLLNDSLGECGRPKIGWQIDPFGHSREQASIFRQMGYDAFFFVRLGQGDKEARKSSKDLEFLWESSDNLDSSEILTSILDAYYAPSDFCWDYLQCSSDAINDDPDSFDYNLDKKVAEFSEHIANYSSYFRTNNIAYAMGGDFQYQVAERNYMNMDKLIRGFVDNENYNVFYSTPSCYIKAIKEAKVPFNKTNSDFFPYEENAHAYWSGYYTSRPTLKRFERVGNKILQASQQLNAFAKMKNIGKGTDYEGNVKPLREIMGTMQHHDAITGTEKERVAHDYVRMLNKGIKDVETSIGKIIGNLLKFDNITEDVTLPISSCLLANISICENSVKDKFMVIIYNPLSRSISHYVRLPSQKVNYTITGPDGQEKYDIVQNMKYPVKTNITPADSEIVFVAKDIPPLGIKCYYIEKINNTYQDANNVLADNRTFGTDNVKFTLDANNILDSVTMNNKTVNISQTFMVYISNNGSGDNITSGAYLFRPINGSSAFHIDYFKEDQTNATEKRLQVTYNRGSLVDEVIQTYNEWLTQTIRIYKNIDNEFIEFDWLVGPLGNDTIDTKFNQGKEIITRFFVSDLENDDFLTDSNGREMIQRKRNNFKYNDSKIEPVTSNYFPVSSKISIRNEDLQVSVLTDRSQGGSSLWNGEIELMVHRRTLKDDSKGVEEPIQEMEFGHYLVVRGQHYLVVGSSNAQNNGKSCNVVSQHRESRGKAEKSTTAQERELALKKLLSPWILVGDATSSEWSLENFQKQLNFEWSGLSKALPDNVHLLNLEPWKDQSYLLRLEHILAKNEDPTYSVNVTVDLNDIFSPLRIVSVAETTLAANDWLSDSSVGSDSKVSLSPMQIRTFIIEISE